MTDDNEINVEVVSVFPNRVRIAVNDLLSFEITGQSLRVGSFLKISDNDNVSLICIIASFSIEQTCFANLSRETKDANDPLTINCRMLRIRLA